MVINSMFRYKTSRYIYSVRAGDNNKAVLMENMTQFEYKTHLFIFNFRNQLIIAISSDKSRINYSHEFKLTLI